MESQGGAGATEGDGQSGQAASTALIEKILSEEPRWQGNQCFRIHLLRGWGLSQYWLKYIH